MYPEAFYLFIIFCIVLTSFSTLRLEDPFFLYFLHFLHVFTFFFFILFKNLLNNGKDYCDQWVACKAPVCWSNNAITTQKNTIFHKIFYISCQTNGESPAMWARFKSQLLFFVFLCKLDNSKNAHILFAALIRKA